MSRNMSGIVGGVTEQGNNEFTGTNTFNTHLPTSTLTPTERIQLTTKAYVDDNFVADAGGTMSGDLTLGDNEDQYILKCDKYNNVSGNMTLETSLHTGGINIKTNGNVEIDNQLDVNGNVVVDSRLAVGTSSASYPVHIQSTIALGSTDQFGYLRQHPTPTRYSGGWSSFGVSLYTYGITYSRQFVLASDERIKRDITDLSNILPLVEQIKPKNYKYKDPKEGENIDYGFIAQELEEVLPCAVNTVRDKIPNILQPADVSNQIFTLQEATDLQEGDDLHIYDEDDKAHEVKITEVINDKSFKTNIAEKEGLKDKYFVYGKFIDDFKTIEHKCLIPVLMKAVQELNEKVETLEAQIKTLI